MLYPWQQAQWQQIHQARRDGRLPHGLLLTGVAGVGKVDFANHLANALLCQQQTEEGHPCETCHACRLVAGRAHPNLLWLEPEKEGGAIKVDQIREVMEFVSQSSLQGEYRIVIIQPANAMNISAANALLKTLEEPARGAILILVSDQSERMPATILSRCQRITFGRPDLQQAMTWLTQNQKHPVEHLQQILMLANGAPLAALKMLETDALTLRRDYYDALQMAVSKQADPIKLAAKLTDIEPLPLLDFTISWITDLLRLTLAGDSSVVTNQDYLSVLTAQHAKLDLAKCTRFLEYLLQQRAQICRGMNFNKQLLAESTLLRWVECSA